MEFHFERVKSYEAFVSRVQELKSLSLLLSYTLGQTTACHIVYNLFDKMTTSNLTDFDDSSLEELAMTLDVEASAYDELMSYLGNDVPLHLRFIHEEFKRVCYEYDYPEETIF